MSRFLAAALLALAIVACRSDGSAKPNGNDPTAPPRTGATTGAPTESAPPRDRMKVYYDLDQYTKQWMNAKREGDFVTSNSLENSVLRPMVDQNRADLVATLRKKEEGRLRIVAARALGFGSEAKTIVPALVAVLGEKSANLQSSVLASLYVLADPETPVAPLATMLTSDDPDVRSNAALALYAVLRARRGGAGAVPLTGEVKEASGRLLALVGNREEDPFVRANAAAALGVIGDPMATDVLVNLLGDDSSVVRTRAAEGLGQLAQETAIPPLVEALGAAKSPNEATVIVAALEKIALVRNLTVDREALGTDPANWRAWYRAVKTPAPGGAAPSR